MSRRPRHDAGEAIVIRVTVERPDPLTGTATAGPGEAIPFEGWLGLLDALSRLVCADGAHPHPLH